MYQQRYLNFASCFMVELNADERGCDFLYRLITYTRVHSLSGCKTVKIHSLLLLSSITFISVRGARLLFALVLARGFKLALLGFERFGAARAARAAGFELTLVSSASSRPGRSSRRI